MHRATLMAMLLAMAGCTQIPEVDQVSTPAKDLTYPKIAPLTDIDAAVGEPNLDAEFADAFSREVDALDNRAKRLQQQEIQ